VTRIHQDGLLELSFDVDRGGRTYLAGLRQRFPLRTTVPLYLDERKPEMAFIYVQNPTGGVFAGDHFVQRVVSRPGTRAHVTTQSATKIYRANGDGARQDLDFHLGEGACLEHIPDPVIPHAGCRFEQTLTVELANRAVFVGAEIIAPGRRASGERFAYDSLRFRTDISTTDGELCAETLLLEPARRPPQSPGLLGQYDYVASLLALAQGRDAEALAARLDRELAGVPEVLGAAGVLPNGAGVLARILARSPIAAQRTVRLAWLAAREELLGSPLPPRRKY
jgi:urease accessory protein